MFKKTIKFSELKSDPQVLSAMKEKDVFQIIHRGQDIKVMMTQEYFFQLMARLEKAEGLGKSTAYHPEKLLSEFEAKIEKLDHLLNENKSKKLA